MVVRRKRERKKKKDGEREKEGRQEGGGGRRGGGEERRGRGRRNREEGRRGEKLLGLTSLQGHILNNLLPPARPYPLKVLTSPNPATSWDQDINTPVFADHS